MQQECSLRVKMLVDCSLLRRGAQLLSGLDGICCQTLRLLNLKSQLWNKSQILTKLEHKIDVDSHKPM